MYSADVHIEHLLHLRVRRCDKVKLAVGEVKAGLV